jgi:F0F1-type ATP synthase membrane subunit b/b'
MENVMPKAREYDAVQKRAAATTEQMQSPVESNLDAASREQGRVLALKIFEEELSQSDQEKFIGDMIKENSVKGYCPPVTVLKGWAAMRWLEKCAKK